MKVFLCTNRGGINDYIKNLGYAYQENKVEVVFGVENFLYSEDLPDFIHIQWPEAIYDWAYKMSKDENTLKIIENRLLYFQKNHIPIVYTVHNELPHHSPSSFDKKIYEIIIQYTDIFAHHGTKSIDLIQEQYTSSKNKIHIITPHGPYEKRESNKNITRQELGIPYSKYVYLNFGSMRANKGKDFLKKCFFNWHQKDSFLLNLGAYIMPKHKNFFNRIKNILFKISSIVFYNKLYFSNKEKVIYKEVSNEELSQFITISDVFFLGHLQGLNSGVIALALSYGKPIVFPDIGNFQEQVKGWQWYECYEAGNQDSAIAALQRMHERVSTMRPESIVFDNEEWLKYNSWQLHVKRIINAVTNIKKDN